MEGTLPGRFMIENPSVYRGIIERNLHAAVPIICHYATFLFSIFHNHFAIKSVIISNCYFFLTIAIL